MQRDMARLRLFMSYLYEKKVLSSIEDQEETYRCADRLSYKKVEKLIIILLIYDSLTCNMKEHYQIYITFYHT